MRTGIDMRTGAVLTGWAHCVQSLFIIITTRIGTRVLLRIFGSRVPDLQDRNATPRRIMEVYTAVAAAIRRWEPGFRLRSIQLMRGAADGQFYFEMSGDFYPRGHLGDYSVVEARSVVLGAGNDNGFRVVRAA